MGDRAENREAGGGPRPIIVLRGVGKCYDPRGEAAPDWALRGLDLAIAEGETVGIIGRNGSGKSTMLQLICGILRPTCGRVDVHGRISPLLELGAGFDPDYSGAENIRLNGSLLGMSRAEISARFDRIVEFSGIGDYIHRPIRTYSSGMFLRLAFAVAIHVEPRILIVDEALAVGDELFQRKCYARIRELREQGCTILFVSHSSPTVIDLCTRAVLLERGRLAMDGPPKQVVEEYHRRLNEERSTNLFVAEPEVGEQRDAVEPLPRRGAVEDVPVDPRFFDPQLQPEEGMAYPRNGARIHDTMIIDEGHRRVNLLRSGGRYRLRYLVDFEHAATNVRFGLLVKTVTGFELGGGSTSSLTQSLDRVDAGELYRVEFHFNASLNGGVYFLNTGVSGTMHGEELYLDRLIDSIAFRVLPEADKYSNGIVDFGIVPELERYD